jgi:hypothetical protein
LKAFTGDSSEVFAAATSTVTDSMVVGSTAADSIAAGSIAADSTVAVIINPVLKINAQHSRGCALLALFVGLISGFDAVV